MTEFEPVLDGGIMRTFEEGDYTLLMRLIDFEEPILQQWEREIDPRNRIYLPLCFVGEDDSRGISSMAHEARTASGTRLDNRNP